MVSKKETYRNRILEHIRNNPGQDAIQICYALNIKNPGKLFAELEGSETIEWFDGDWRIVEA